MSENPFADSRGARLDDNPFNDTSDPNASNPFDDPSASTYSIPDASSTAAGAKTYPYPQDSREAELERRDREIRAREDELARREREMDRSEGKANWPFFFPLIRHEIGDLPHENQATMKLIYFQWLALLATLVLNLVACILLLIAGSSDGGKDTAASGSYILVISLTSFFLWYRPIYLGYAKERGLALFFYLFFFFAGWHLLFSCYMLIGIPSTGSAGLINTISMLSQHHILAGVFGVVSTAGWAVQTLGGALVYKRVWNFKNNHAELNFQNATDQFKRESFKTVVLHQSRI